MKTHDEVAKAKIERSGVRAEVERIDREEGELAKLPTLADNISSVRRRWLRWRRGKAGIKVSMGGA